MQLFIYIGFRRLPKLKSFNILLKISIPKRFKGFKAKSQYFTSKFKSENIKAEAFTQNQSLKEACLPASSHIYTDREPAENPSHMTCCMPKLQLFCPTLQSDNRLNSLLSSFV